ncbi:P1 family peptidase [Allobranchiibius sp. GilTou73]|uniref:P1 family peptidase n=1 Tax=Allobranchiibius sp. GilTou73 TaxID=2904523 RepID=UPI001F1AC8BB|nr:P1 family peptidase [Allobranchiibius sp. GilTou73]UIJ35255.1 P1 family peptidase [Allobranchiibius sp. GilTou73]
MTLTPGPTNSLGDVAGVRVGHHQRVGDGWLTGTTCVLAPPDGATGGVDIRGGAPGTRETDLLDPRNVIEQVHAVVLSGGSAFGLAAATGVMDALAEDGVGFRIGEPDQVVPIVPAAVVFDLLRGGDYRARPDAGFGRAAYADALAGRATAFSGCVGAGTGARIGGLKGGIGSASQLLPGGGVVAALVVANAFGSAVDQATGELYAARFGLPGEFDGLDPHPAPSDAESGNAPRWPGADDVRPGRATTLVVIATDLSLTKAQCQKTAGIGHDGLARAVRPVHTMLDGDSIFALATGQRAAPDAVAYHQLLEGAADCATRAVGHAVLAADTTAGMRSYCDVHCAATQEDARG